MSNQNDTNNHRHHLDGRLSASYQEPTQSPPTLLTRRSRHSDGDDDDDSGRHQPGQRQSNEDREGQDSARHESNHTTIRLARRRRLRELAQRKRLRETQAPKQIGQQDRPTREMELPQGSPKDTHGSHAIINMDGSISTSRMLTMNDRPNRMLPKKLHNDDDDVYKSSTFSDIQDKQETRMVSSSLPSSTKGNTFSNIQDDQEIYTSSLATFPTESMDSPHDCDTSYSSGEYPGAVHYYPRGNVSIAGQSSTSIYVGSVSSNTGQDQLLQQQEADGNAKSLPEADAIEAEGYINITAVAVPHSDENMHVTTICGTFSKRTILVVSIIILFFILTTIIVALVLLDTTNDDPLPIRTVPIPTVFLQFVDYLESQHNVVVDMKDLSDQNSTRYKALSWLVNDELVESPDSPIMLERYILAVLYYSTDGIRWDDNAGWLSNTTICSWYGVSCGEKVVGLQLGKSVYMRDIL